MPPENNERLYQTESQKLEVWLEAIRFKLDGDPRKSEELLAKFDDFLDGTKTLSRLKRWLKGPLVAKLD